MTIHLSPRDKAARAKAMRKAREQTPAGIAKRRARQRKHGKTPGAQAKRKARESTVEARARRKPYSTKNYNRPLSIEARLRRIVSRLPIRISKLTNKGRTLMNTITHSDLLTLYAKQGGRCALTGWELTPLVKCKNTISIDRIDNSKGYTIDNIQLVAAQANRAKNKWTNDEFIELCRAVARRTS